MEIQVFLAGPTDAPSFDNIHPDVFDGAPDAHLTQTYLDAPHLHIALARDGDLVVGMCSGVVYHHPDKPPQWWINEAGVATPWRRQGIASRLVELCAQEATRLGCTEIWVISDPTEMAEGFWQSLGWDRMGTRLAMFTRTLA